MGINPNYYDLMEAIIPKLIRSVIESEQHQFKFNSDMIDALEGAFTSAYRPHHKSSDELQEDLKIRYNETTIDVNFQTVDSIINQEPEDARCDLGWTYASAYKQHHSTNINNIKYPDFIVLDDCE